MKNRTEQKMTRLCALICFAVLSLSTFASSVFSLPVSAADNIAEAAGMTVSLIFEESDGKEIKKRPLEGAEILLYKVASLTMDSNGFYYVLEPAFENSGIDVNNMTAAKSLDAAKKLQELVKENNPEAAASGKTDSAGQIYFSNLQPGMYLGMQKEAVKVDGRTVHFQPSLWMVPEGKQDADGTVSWDYSVSVYPKVGIRITRISETMTVRTTTTTKTTRSTSTTKTTRKDTEKGKTTRSGRSVRTGDENEVLMYLGIAIMSICIIWFLYTRRKKKQE